MTPIDVDEARQLLGSDGPPLTELIARADAVRRRSRGDAVQLCAIVNARCGGCPEDCAFCAQSAHHPAEVTRYRLLDEQALVDAAREAASHGVQRFSIVTSGRAVRAGAEAEAIARAVERITGELGLTACASLGRVDEAVLARLRDAGLDRYHGNLEAAESHFPAICSTRPYQAAVDTLRTARRLGLSLCSCGIFGMGETEAQRVELLDAVRQLDVDSVPINFLHPIPGTPLADAPPLAPRAGIRLVAVARLMMPDREIRVCGGREHALRDLQSWLLPAGVDGLMVGDYLTTRGRSVGDDLRMIADAGRTVARTAGRRR